MEILCKAVLTENVTSREEYDAFVRSIEGQLRGADVVSVEMGEIARIKIDVTDDAGEQWLAEAIGDTARVERVTQVETLAE